MKYLKPITTIEHLCRSIQILSAAVDDYLYVYDFQNDFYFISPLAAERFCMPCHAFHHVLDVHKQFVHPDDFPIFKQEFCELQTSRTPSYNKMYRWMTNDQKPVWINCRGNIFYENGRASYAAGCISEIGLRQNPNCALVPDDSGLRSFLKSFVPPFSQGAFLRFGIDTLKGINAHLGIEYGDMILRKTAECISSNLFPGQKLFRIISDEYLVADFYCKNESMAKKLYKRVTGAIDAFIIDNNYKMMFTVSCGIIRCEDIDDFSYSNVMKLTEFSLNEAKRRGKNQCYLFEKEDYLKFLRKNTLTQQLRQSVNQGFLGFEAYFQPLIHTDTQKLYGAESLMRFHSATLGMISPIEFIPILEETGLMIPAGRWILEQALSACKRFQQFIPDFKISINLSHVQVSQSHIGSEIISAVQKYGISPQNVMIELTESGLLETDPQLIKAWAYLKSKGISLALDDFGTGYSNFSYLTNLKPNTIKIDRGFTSRALTNDYKYQLLSLFSTMAHELNLEVCIEGVETKEELASVCHLSPDYIQGYYFGCPCSYSHFMNTYIKSCETGKL